MVSQSGWLCERQGRENADAMRDDRDTHWLDTAYILCTLDVYDFGPKALAAGGVGGCGLGKAISVLKKLGERLYRKVVVIDSHLIA